MNYLKLNKFPEFEDNPFLDEAIQDVTEHTKNKKIFMKGDRSIMNYVYNDQGNMVGYSSFLRNIKVDDSQFIKVYINRFAAFYELSVPARKVLGYIIQECIIPNRDIFYIDFTEAKKITKYTGENSIRSGIASLISHGLIARTRNPYKYYLNPLIIFNGDRVSFVETYIKKKSNQ